MKVELSHKEIKALALLGINGAKEAQKSILEAETIVFDNLEKIYKVVRYLDGNSFEFISNSKCSIAVEACDILLIDEALNKTLFKDFPLGKELLVSIGNKLWFLVDGIDNIEIRNKTEELYEQYVKDMMKSLDKLSIQSNICFG